MRDRSNDFGAQRAGDYPTFFVGFDPSGDGFSRSVVVTVVFDGERCIVLSVETLTVCSTDVAVGEWLVNHALAIRSTIAGMRFAKAVFCIENNSILVAESVHRAIRESHISNYALMHENRQYASPSRGGNPGNIDVRAGTRTTQASKEQIMARIRNLLLRKALVFHHQFFLPHPDKQPRGEVTNARDLFVDEISHIHAEQVRPKGPVASQTAINLKYKGFNPDGSRAKDDKVMALGFCLLCQPLFDMAPDLYSVLPPLYQ